jgi:hypothetical protein
LLSVLDVVIDVVDDGGADAVRDGERETAAAAGAGAATAVIGRRAVERRP